VRNRTAVRFVHGPLTLVAILPGSRFAISHLQVLRRAQVPANEPPSILAFFWHTPEESPHGRQAGGSFG
jgi:hypothetical protein